MQIDGTVILKGWCGDRWRAVASVCVFVGMTVLLVAVVLADVMQRLTDNGTTMRDLGGRALWVIVLLAFPVVVIGVGRVASREHSKKLRAWIDDVATQLEATIVRAPE